MRNVAGSSPESVRKLLSVQLALSLARGSWRWVECENNLRRSYADFREANVQNMYKVLYQTGHLKTANVTSVIIFNQAKHGHGYLN